MERKRLNKGKPIEARTLRASAALVRATDSADAYSGRDPTARSRVQEKRTGDDVPFTVTLRTLREHCVECRVR